MNAYQKAVKRLQVTLFMILIYVLRHEVIPNLSGKVANNMIYGFIRSVTYVHHKYKPKLSGNVTSGIFMVLIEDSWLITTKTYQN